MTAEITNALSMRHYLDNPALSSSGVTSLLRSPLAFHDAAKRETAAMARGTATHTAVFEPARFASEYVVYRESKTVGEGARKRWAAFKEANAHLTIIDTGEHDTALKVAEAVRNHPAAKPYITEGDSEVSIFWNEGETRCKLRADRLGSAIVDLKTTRDPSPQAFTRQSFNLSYHVKAAWYQRGVGEALGVKKDVIIIAAETSAPYDVVVYRVPEYALTAAWIDCETALALYRKCRATGRWPGISDTILELDLPTWAYRETEETTLEIGNEEVRV